MKKLIRVKKPSLLYCLLAAFLLGSSVWYLPPSIAYSETSGTTTITDPTFTQPTTETPSTEPATTGTSATGSTTTDSIATDSATGTTTDTTTETTAVETVTVESTVVKPTVSVNNPFNNQEFHNFKVNLSGTYTNTDPTIQNSNLVFSASEDINGAINEFSNSESNTSEWNITSTTGNEGTWSFTHTYSNEGPHKIVITIKDNTNTDNTSNTSSISFTISTRPYIYKSVIMIPGSPDKELNAEDLTSVPVNAQIKITLVDDKPMTELDSKVTSNNPINVLLMPISKTQSPVEISGDSTVAVNADPPAGKYAYDITFKPSKDLENNKTYLVYLDPSLSDDNNNLVFAKFFKFSTKTNTDWDDFDDNSSGKTSSNPHGHYNLNTNMCAACHSTHVNNPMQKLDPVKSQAEGGSYLVEYNDKLQQDASRNYCMACHDGTTNAPFISNIEKEYHHNNPAEYGDNASNTLKQPEACTSCHNPHLEWSSDNPNLLKDHYVYTHKEADRNKKGLSTLVVDSLDTACESCHDDYSIFNRTTYPDGFYKALQYAKTLTATGTIDSRKVDVNFDHTDKLAPTVTDYSLCLRCHNAEKATAKLVLSDIETYYTDQNSKHLFMLAGSQSMQDDGSKLNGTLPCAECHETHGSNNIKMLRDELGNLRITDPSKKFVSSGKTWDATNERNFCTKCHNGSTDIYGKTARALDITKSEGHDPSTDKGKQACSLCHGGASKSFIEAAHAPKTGTP
ncbi:cytochrome c3 family protein [Neobacillus terrae]|uniref:cytochrome c3 family protein n=1 Tax=Neobacillus terrae TaxID=3034837 RepID=UPI00140B8698|nr:cytochrome c3 family protein [Neobacillus terrae]NHM29948.1 hypothetical protein [Neobacillus terrae]